MQTLKKCRGVDGKLMISLFIDMPLPQVIKVEEEVKKNAYQC